MKQLALLLLFATSLFAQSGDKVQGQGTPPTTPFKIAAPTTATAFVINNNSQMVLSIARDGKVTYGPGYEPNEAAKEFWKYVEHYAPDPCPIVTLTSPAPRATETPSPK